MHSVYNKTNYLFLNLFSCHYSACVLQSSSVLYRLFSAHGRSSECLCNLINPWKVLNVIKRERRRGRKECDAWHTTSHRVYTHNIFMQKTNSPRCLHANMSSYTYMLEQTGTTRACEYRREERFNMWPWLYFIPEEIKIKPSKLTVVFSDHGRLDAVIRWPKNNEQVLIVSKNLPLCRETICIFKIV